MATEVVWDEGALTLEPGVHDITFQASVDLAAGEIYNAYLGCGAQNAAGSMDSVNPNRCTITLRIVVELTVATAVTATILTSAGGVRDLAITPWSQLTVVSF